MYRYIKNPPYEKQPSKQAYIFFCVFLGEKRRARTEGMSAKKQRLYAYHCSSCFFRAFSLARDSRFALASLLRQNTVYLRLFAFVYEEQIT